MRKIYIAGLRIQYAVWGIYFLSLLFVYILSFFVDTLGLRWFLIPATLAMLSTTIALSVAIVAMFIVQGRRKDIGSADRFAILPALPSFLVLAGVFFYLLDRALR
jgi:hypothetical protein